MNKIDVDKQPIVEINKSLIQTISCVLADDKLNDKEKLHFIRKVMQFFDEVDDLLTDYKILMRNKEVMEKTKQ